MKTSDIARAVSSNTPLVLAALDSLTKIPQPLVEEHQKLQQERIFSISSAGVRFVRNLLQDLVSTG